MGLPVINIRYVPLANTANMVIKRAMDIAGSLVGIVISSPVMLIAAILVKLSSPGPVIFKQERVGLHNKSFYMYKFRSMTDARDENGELLPDAVRLTAFGRFLRSTSLDELPELWNIFRGDMSIVGPRPLLVKYLPLYNEEQRHRHDVRPGLTGLAQVHGRNALSWEERFTYDVDYVSRITALGDLKILLQTVSSVMRREGISSGTSATMEEFQGTGDETRCLNK